MKALVADEELQRMLVSRAGSNDLLMRGFIGECKAIMNSSQQSPPAQSLPEPKSEILFFFLFFKKKKKTSQLLLRPSVSSAQILRKTVSQRLHLLEAQCSSRIPFVGNSSSVTSSQDGVLLGNPFATRVRFEFR